jgi:hypothetical protein
MKQMIETERGEGNGFSRMGTDTNGNDNCNRICDCCCWCHHRGLLLRKENEKTI